MNEPHILDHLRVELADEITSRRIDQRVGLVLDRGADADEPRVPESIV